MNIAYETMKTAVLLIAHGSREAGANLDLEHVAAELTVRQCCDMAIASFLELAQPDIVEGARMCIAGGAQRIVMLPYFLSAGTHVRRDLANARERLSGMFPEVEFLLAEPLGRHPLLADVVVDRVREAVG
jgi:sirohydrochlorin ferrochelatase